MRVEATGLGISTETMFCLLRFGVFCHCAQGAMPILPDSHLPKQNPAGGAIISVISTQDLGLRAELKLFVIYICASPTSTYFMF